MKVHGYNPSQHSAEIARSRKVHDGGGNGQSGGGGDPAQSGLGGDSSNSTITPAQIAALQQVQSGLAPHSQ